ncbi:MAG: class I SAM-dependent methyltransferase [Alphaproteobacteria bacterium]|nr:class I SAM-dependent methyltransferase [Alphaproteobacteria bacterium]
MTAEQKTRCRLCGGDGMVEFLSFGEAPIADGLIREDQLEQQDPTAPLRTLFCTDCTLVQIGETVDPVSLFGDAFRYLSSCSETLLADAEENAQQLIRASALDRSSLVVEIGSNDGHLLKHFLDRGINVLGIDPAPSPAQVAEESGIPTRRAFFSGELAEGMVAQGLRADIVIANNVLAHVPALTDFVSGISLILKPEGVAVIEVPWIFRMMQNLAYDTIYHQHVFYFSLTAISDLLGRHNLFVNDVRHIDSQGGSLRLYIGRQKTAGPSVTGILEEELARGVRDAAIYFDFSRRVEAHRRRLHDMLADLKAKDRRIAAYGASAKGTALLHACGLNNAMIDYVVDRNQIKQGYYMPGSRLPIRSPDLIAQDRPDHVLLLSWNLADEILAQQNSYLEAGGEFIVPIPEPRTITQQSSVVMGSAAASHQ